MYISTPYHKIVEEYKLPWIKLLSDYKLSGTTKTSNNPGVYFSDWQDNFVMDLSNNSFRSKRTDYNFSNDGYTKDPAISISSKFSYNSNTSNYDYKISISISGENYENESRILSMPTQCLKESYFTIVDTNYFCYEVFLYDTDDKILSRLYGKINIITKEETFYTKTFSNIVYLSSFSIENFLYVKYTENDINKMIRINLIDGTSEQITIERYLNTDIYLVGTFSDGIVFREPGDTTEYKYIRVDKYLNILQEITSPVYLSKGEGDLYNNLILYSYNFDVRYKPSKQYFRLYDISNDKNYYISSILNKTYPFYVDANYVYGFRVDSQYAYRDDGTKYGYKCTFSLYYMSSAEFFKIVCSDKYLVS